MRLWVVVSVVSGLSLASGAWAQGALRVDCSNPATPADKAGCARLAGAHQALASAYDRFMQLIDGPAQAHLKTDQATWQGASERFCVASAGTSGSAAAEARDCLTERTRARQQRLEVMPHGRHYPFISDHMRIEAGTAGRVRYMFVASYPRFDRPGADNSRANARVAKTASETIDAFKPKLGEAVVRDDRALSFDFDYRLIFPASGMVSVVSTYQGFLGDTARPANGIEATMVELATGRVLGPRDILQDGAPAAMLTIVHEYLRLQYRQRHGADMPLVRDAVATLLRDPWRWIAREDRLEVVFNATEVGPASSDPYTVAFPYKHAAALIRRDGPLGSRLP